MKRKKRYTFNDLVRIMRQLRGTAGCAWDREQDHASLLPYLFEEAKEAARAVRKQDFPNLQEELGDLLLQIVFHAQIADDHNRFDIHRVVDGIARKLVRRHPHVFGKTTVRSTQDIIDNWHRIKKKEKRKARAGR